MISSDKSIRLIAQNFTTVCYYSFKNLTTSSFPWQPLNMEHYDSVRSMSSEIRAYAPDARVLTTYYSGMRHNLAFVCSIHSTANSDSGYTTFPARLIICMALASFHLVIVQVHW